MAIVAGPVLAVGSLTAVALAQPSPEAGPVPAAAYRFGAEAAKSLATIGWWAGETDPVALSRDATRRDLVRLIRPLMRLPAGATGAPWRDIAADDPDGAAARRAVERRWLTTAAGQVSLDQPVTGFQAQRAFTLALGMDKAVARMSRFRDDAGRTFRLPVGFGVAITAREAGLRRNYPASDDSLERTDQQALRLADLVLMTSRARAIRGSGIPPAVRALESFSIPAIDPAVAPLVQRALTLVGNPYVWGGEWPDPASPLDPQAAGGFDCSGFIWYVWRTGDRQAEASLNVPDGRTTYTMNVGTRGTKIPMVQAAAGDLVFFGDQGPKTPDSSASHVGISLGNRWIIHSTGGRAGPSITYVPTYWPQGVQDARTFRVVAAPAVPVETTPAAATPAAPVPAPQPTPAPTGAQSPPPA